MIGICPYGCTRAFCFSLFECALSQTVVTPRGRHPRRRPAQNAVGGHLSLPAYSIQTRDRRPADEDIFAMMHGSRPGSRGQRAVHEQA